MPSVTKLVKCIFLLASSADAFRSIATRRSLRGAPPRAYTPSPMDPEVVYRELAVVAASAAAAGWWWTVTVPDKRLELSKSKSEGGEVREYLEDLRDDETRAVEKWLLADWLAGKTKKPAALPFLKKAKFNSGDNPILAASGLIGAAVITTAIVEQVLGSGGGVR
jgi:hypothetical protein